MSSLPWKDRIQVFTFWKYLITTATCHHQKGQPIWKTRLFVFFKKIISRIVKFSEWAWDPLSGTGSLLFSSKHIERFYYLKYYTLPPISTAKWLIKLRVMRGLPLEPSTRGHAHSFLGRLPALWRHTLSDEWVSEGKNVTPFIKH